MKKTVFYLILISVLVVSCTSDPAVDRAFDKYSSKEGSFSITVPGFAVRTALMFADLKPEEEKLVKKVDLVKVLAIEDGTNIQNVHFKKEFATYIGAGYVPLASIHESHNDVQVYAKMLNEENISDLLVMISGDDNVMVYVKGDFNIQEIADNTDFLKGKSWAQIFN